MFLNKELAIVGGSQYGKTFLANLFIGEAFKQLNCYEKRPIVINAYKREDYRHVSYSRALETGKREWTAELKERVEDRIVVVDDLNMVHNRVARKRFVDMFDRRRFDLVTIAQDLSGLKEVLGKISLFVFFGLRDLKLVSNAVRSKHANELQERIRQLHEREYIIVDNRTKMESYETFPNHNVEILLQAFKNGLNVGRRYCPEECVNFEEDNDKFVLTDKVLELKKQGERNKDIAKNLNRSVFVINSTVYRLKQNGELPNVDGRWRCQK